MKIETVEKEKVPQGYAPTLYVGQCNGRLVQLYVPGYMQMGLSFSDTIKEGAIWVLIPKIEYPLPE